MSNAETRHFDGLKLLEAWTSFAEEFIRSCVRGGVRERRPEFDSWLATIQAIANEHKPRYQDWSHWISSEVRLRGPDPSLDGMIREGRTPLDFDSSWKDGDPSEYEVQIAYGRVIYHLRFAVPLLITTMCDRRRVEIANYLSDLDHDLRKVFEGIFFDSDEIKVGEK